MCSVIHCCKNWRTNKWYSILVFYSTVISKIYLFYALDSFLSAAAEGMVRRSFSNPSLTVFTRFRSRAFRRETFTSWGGGMGYPCTGWMATEKSYQNHCKSDILDRENCSSGIYCSTVVFGSSHPPPPSSTPSASWARNVQCTVHQKVLNDL